MSNFGLELAMRELGIEVVKTQVGDRYVLEEMQRGGYNLGGEQSGHVLFLDHTTTGDGLITALAILAVMRSRNAAALGAGARHAEVPAGADQRPGAREARPRSGRVGARRPWSAVERALGGRGRVYIRYSGTEALARVMVEGEDLAQVESYASDIADAVRSASAAPAAKQAASPPETVAAGRSRRGRPRHRRRNTTSGRMARLGVNIDHVATCGRRAASPIPTRSRRRAPPRPAAPTASPSTCARTAATSRTPTSRRCARRCACPLNLEMAATPEMVAIALRVRPDDVCLVPERRAEVTTEGGLDVVGQRGARRATWSRGCATAASGSASSSTPTPAQIDAARARSAPTAVELHTGRYCEAADAARAIAAELARLAPRREHGPRRSASIVNAGHGLHYDNVAAVAALPAMDELNIGHSIVARAVCRHGARRARDARAASSRDRHDRGRDARAWTRSTIERFGMPGAVLMERAGTGAAAIAARRASRTSASTAWWCWRARATTAATASSSRARSRGSGCAVEVCLAVAPSEVRGDARAKLARVAARRRQGPAGHGRRSSSRSRARSTRAGCVVDALFGTGLGGDVDGPRRRARSPW